MGTMQTAGDPKNYQPTKLIAPDGREFTAGSLREHNELVSLGYRIAPVASEESTPNPVETRAPAETSSSEAQTVAPATTETAAPSTSPTASTTAPTTSVSAAARGKGATK
ncbi:hypothetical protein SEA_WHACK_13 [Rhodococcus phage Whack]|uniref:Uncharacterized protein n=1 Tax=Rhodococcus phage Whack TaxID=2591132 RepID=A0A515MK80_9CAUD|nr:hypothetical protein HWC40_gp13 [Rhodococcus phage Whack]QDM57076.1 hypothetical protein SEA_WHACK_13 [Rhodococcus phage Whack]